MVWRIVNVAILGQSLGKVAHALSHLESVNLLHDDTEGGVDLDFAIPFAGLQSLRTLCGNMVLGCPTAVPDPSTGEPPTTDENDPDRCKHAKAGEQCPIISLDSGDEGQLDYKTCSMWPLEPRISNVETLQFSCSNIAPEAVELFLPAVKNLRKFEYESGGALVGDESFRPHDYVEALLKYQGHSLEHLEITSSGGESEDTCVKDLREFQTLKVAKLDLALLSDDEVHDDGEPVVSRLVDLLPPSIETFCLTPPGSLTEMEAAFEDFVEGHEEALPMLKRLCVMHSPEEIGRLAEKIGRQAGLDVEVVQNQGLENTEEMETGMAAFLERRSRGEEWREGDPYRWVVPASS